MRNPTLGRHARNAQQSAHPELWPDVGMWSTELGNQGETLFDSSGNGLHIPINGITPSDWEPSDNGMLLNYDGVDNYAHSTLPGLALQSKDFTFMVCFKANSTGPNNDLRIFNIESSLGWCVLFFNNSGTNQLKWAYHAGSSQSIVAPNNGITLGKYHVAHCRFRKNPTLMELFIDGVVVASTTADPGSTTLSGFMLIGGNSPGSRLFDGDIGVVSRWSKCLTNSSISKLVLDPIAPLRLRPTYFGRTSGGGPAPGYPAAYYDNFHIGQPVGMM